MFFKKPHENESGYDRKGKVNHIFNLHVDITLMRQLPESCNRERGMTYGVVDAKGMSALRFTLPHIKLIDERTQPYARQILNVLARLFS